MKSRFPILGVLLVMLAISLIGCGGEPDANIELEKAAKALEQADAGQSTPAPAPQAQPMTPAARQSPGQEMNQAVTLYKSGDYEKAVMRLHTLRDRATLTPQQNMALQDAMAAVMTDMYRRAADGDARAQQAVKQYEQSKTARPR
jgi:hypothetical protein